MIFAYLEPELLDPGPCDDDVGALNCDTHTRVVDFDLQRAVRRPDFDDRLDDTGDFRGFTQAEAADQQQQNDCRQRS